MDDEEDAERYQQSSSHARRGNKPPFCSPLHSGAIENICFF